MGCIGGCVGGPKKVVSAEMGKKSLEDCASGALIKVPTHSETMDKVLKDLGINSLKDFEVPEKIEIFEREF